MPICIYHHNCVDGFGAAWVVKQALGGSVEFHPGRYGEAPPDVASRHVILVDFSYKRDVLLDMSLQAASILILDHHKSAQEELVDLPSNIRCVFDMNRSGARIAWDHFFPNTPVPTLIRYIEDRDLWRFSLPHTREVNATLFSYPYDFEIWEGLMNLDHQRVIEDGKAIERKHFKDIEELLKVSTREMNILDYNVRVANLPYTMSSDAAHELAIGNPFGACYYDSPTGRVFSLRSTEDGIDVSKIAQAFGGGGHKHAAGFKVSFKVAETFEMDYIKGE